MNPKLVSSFLISLLVALSALAADASNQAETSGIGSQDRSACLFPVERDGKSGYIDQTGEIAIALEFEGADSFHEGLAPVKLGGKKGFIDPSGKMVITPQFDEASSFSEGLAAFQRNKKWGYIDRTGREVIPARFDSAGQFAEGLAAVEIGEESGYVDRTGELAIPLQFESAWQFSEGLAAVELGSKYGYINTSGELVIRPQFIWGEQFSDGLASVVSDRKLNIIDKTGRTVIKLGKLKANLEPATYAMWPFLIMETLFSEDVAAAPFGGKWGFIDRRGKKVIRPRYVTASRFSEGLAAVTVWDRQPDGSHKAKWGFVNKQGRVVISPRFDTAGNFSCGVAWVTIGERSQYIDRQGNSIWPPSRVSTAPGSEREASSAIVPESKPPEPVSAEQRRAMMIGRWYGEAPTDSGQTRRWVTERFPDGTYKVTFRTYTKDGGYDDHVEVGEWGVSGSIYFTITKGVLVDGEIVGTDPGSTYYRDAYNIIRLDEQAFEYELVEPKVRFTVRRVDDDFQLPEFQ